MRENYCVDDIFLPSTPPTARLATARTYMHTLALAARTTREMVIRRGHRQGSRRQFSKMVRIVCPRSGLTSRGTTTPIPCLTRMHYPGVIVSHPRSILFGKLQDPTALRREDASPGSIALTTPREPRGPCTVEHFTHQILISHLKRLITTP